MGRQQQETLGVRPRAAREPSRRRRNVAALVASNALAGVGVAVGAAVSALLTERLGGTSVAGVAQAVGVLAAAVAAIPLARLAARRGRRTALGLGYGAAAVGALVIVLSAVLGSLLVQLAGIALFGLANAATLQSRFAAADDAPAETRGRTMSVVVWATTVGSVLGPNLSAPGDALGRRLGVPELAGPFLLALVALLAAAAVVAALYRGPARADAPDPAVAVVPATSRQAIGWARRHPVTRFALVMPACAHAVMIVVMVMTPLHMQHEGMTLELVGLVISLHILGMFALSPVFGWLADRVGGVRTAAVGTGLLAVALALGATAALADGGAAGAHAGHAADGGAPTEVLTAVALLVLGLGWSASVIGASALLASVVEPHVRVPLQGVSDAAMNYAGAAAAAAAGTVLAWGGFGAVNGVAALVLLPALAMLLLARRSAAAG
ncbi:MFS transporter [Isoptericola variabilis]|uniref:Major facilitator superfamily MFS_1 n=1 Tax=Isoptericola variabilis (strain 225) TaxID=743718 RepID=F6FVR9_ISOV2|nr:MFS transporter [Isoptericola variabilis]AEG45570.1 major facilitator superfamily MFS_1 [Isoptericola variabilis 225]